jgi:hypothetical protein
VVLAVVVQRHGTADLALVHGFMDTDARRKGTEGGLEADSSHHSTGRGVS